jgi:two-component system, NarL family, response regulator DegU
MDKITLLIVDDHPIYRQGLARLFEHEPGFECVGTAADGVEAIHLCKELEPDIVLMDVNMPKLNGRQATREIHKLYPKTAIIMLSTFEYEAYVLDSLRSGASAYILKTEPFEKIVSAIRLVHGGGSVLDTRAADKLVRHLQNGDGNNGKGTSTIDILNRRELEILNLTASGLSNKGIGAKLGLTERTVQTYLFTIFSKLGASSRTQAVIYALKEGWIDINDAFDKTEADGQASDNGD